MKPDKLLKNVKRLETPATLEDRVMSHVRASAGKFPVKRNFTQTARQTLFRKSWILPLAAVAVLVIAIRLIDAPELPQTPVTAQRQDDLADFVDQALYPVFGQEPVEVAGTDTGEQEGEIERFVFNQLDQIFWITKGGEDA